MLVFLIVVNLVNALVNKDLVLKSYNVNKKLDFIKIEEDNLIFYDSSGLIYKNVLFEMLNIIFSKRSIFIK